MTEYWKDIPGRDYGGYQASRLGRVRSVPRRLADGRAAGGVVLARQPDKDGYPTVKIRGRRVRVSVIVQLAFAGPPEVRHLDADRSNCRPENLAYGSKVENEQDKKGTGRKGIDGRGCYPPFPPVAPVTGGLQR